MSAPEILEASPNPRPIQKPFHGRKILVWEGRARISNIHGWVRNPRMDVELKAFKDQHANRDPSDEEIYELMTSVLDFRLKELAGDIHVNGVRNPIILTSDGDLLDGNRRYFASKYVLEKMKVEDPDRKDYETIPAWVLDSDCTTDDEKHIIVQENFYTSNKVEWPDYVKAKHIYEDIMDGLSVQAVSQRYSWNKSKINETKRIMELIDEFNLFATSTEEEGLGISEVEAEREATENYQFFNEAQKSYRQKLAEDVEFKLQFFQWIHSKKFKSFQEVRVAGKAWDHEEAKRILLSDDAQGGKKAKAIIDYEASGIKQVEDTEKKIREFVIFLEGLTTLQKSQISDETFDSLAQGLKIVIKMTEMGKKGSDL